ncbi:MAG: diguanylate cyclase [Lachnospiraceae bacterium]|nr:diguanylate cyclase [Lachnospiraceae bacterium]
MYIISKIIKSLIVMLISLFMVGVGFIPVLAQEDNGVIRVAFFQMDGFNETDENGKHSGFGYEYLREVAKYTGWKYEFVSAIQVKDFRGNPTGEIKPLTYSAAMEMVKNGELDIVGMVEKNNETERIFEFPQLDVCRQYGVLSVLENDTRININDPRTLDGIKVGVIRGVAKNMDMLEYLKKQGIKKYSIISFQNQKELSDALHNNDGLIDAMYTTSLRNIENEKVILKWKPKPYYFVTGKGKNEIIEKIDYAQELMEINTPSFKEHLSPKYYSVSPSDVLMLTKDEKQYINEHPTVTVAVDSSWIPIEYYDNETNTYKGIIADILTKVEERTGLKFNYVVANSYEEAIDLVRDGKAQVLSGIVNDYYIADQLNLDVTVPYVEINMSAVTKKNITNLYDENNLVAVVSGYSTNEIFKKSMPKNTFVYYDCTEECLDAVKKGKADVAFVSTYSAEYLMHMPKYNSLVAFWMTDFGVQMGFGLNNEENKQLYHIMNKTVGLITKQEIDEIVVKNVLSATDYENWEYLFYRHPTEVSLIFMFVILILAFSGIRLRNAELRNRKQRLRDEERFRIAISKTNICVWDLDIINKQVINTESSMEIYGTPKVIVNIPESLINSGVYHPDDVEIIRDAYKRVYAGETDVKYTYRIKNVMPQSKFLGEYRWEKSIYTTIYDAEGKPLRAVGVAENVTQRMMDLEKKKKAEQFRAATVEGSIAFLEIDLDEEEVLFCDKTFEPYKNSYGNLKISDAVEKIGRKYVHSADFSKMARFFDVSMLRKKYEKGITEAYREIRIKSRTHGNIWCAFVINLVRDEDSGHIIGYFTAKNVDERKKYELSLKNKAEQDMLTGMYNRNTFEGMTKKALADRRNTTFLSAFMVIDIDNFKSINDTMGHDCGDEAIKLVANALRLAFRANDILGRLGDDEFVVFMNRVVTPEDVEKKAEIVCETIRNIVSKKYHDLKITVSVGVAITTEDVKTFDMLYKKADDALYVAKNNGKNGFWVYNREK